MGEAQMPLPDTRSQTAVSLEYMLTFPASAPHTTEIFYTIQKLALKTHDSVSQFMHVTSILHFWKSHSFTLQSSELHKASSE